MLVMLKNVAYFDVNQTIVECMSYPTLNQNKEKHNIQITKMKKN